ncbi:TonB-dependent receptor, partial [Fusobacterium sp.]|uniref:TonB-dependent receptor domain-containing protein n=1 Tax=Fusobacterium sp. TaxID=68766 RepID=UPI002607D2BA
MNKKVLLVSFIMSAMAYAQGAEIKLDDTVVTSTTGFETSVRKVVASPTVVTSKEIEEKGYRTVSDALKDIPAVNVIGNTFGSIIDLRGQGGLDGSSSGAKANVQVMVDGVAVNSLDTSMVSSPINTIDVKNIERIEVIPGGGAVLYGSGTAGGVINIITKKGTGLRGNAGYNFSTLGMHKSDVSVGQTIGKFDIDLSFNKNEGDGYRKDSKSDSQYFQGKVRYDINKDHNLEFKYARYDENKNLLDSLTKEQLDEDRKQGNSTKYMNTMDIKKDDYQLTYNGKLTDNLSTNVIVFRSETDMLMGMPGEGEQVMKPGKPPIPYTSDVKWTFKDKKTGIKPKLKYNYGNDSSLIFGMDYIKNDGGRYGKINNTLKMGPTMTRPMNVQTDMDLNKETLAGFVMNNYRVGDFEFNQGFRYEKAKYETTRNSIITPPFGPMQVKPTYTNEKDENNYAYELSGNYFYSDTGKTYLRYERGFTSPAPALLTNKDTKGEYILNDLESETYNNIEVGMADYLGNTSVNLAFFYSQMNDEIFTKMTGSMGSSAGSESIINYNIDKTERMGAELKLQQNFGKLTLSQSYQYVNAEIKDGVEKKFGKNGE